MTSSSRQCHIVSDYNSFWISGHKGTLNSESDATVVYVLDSKCTKLKEQVSLHVNLSQYNVCHGKIKLDISAWGFPPDISMSTMSILAKFFTIVMPCNGVPKHKGRLSVGKFVCVTSSQGIQYVHDIRCDGTVPLLAKNTYCKRCSETFCRATKDVAGMMNSQPVYVSNHTNHAFLSVALSMLNIVKYFTLEGCYKINPIPVL